MTVVNKIVIPDPDSKDWENPGNPEKAEDNRDAEQLLRQKREAERRHDNLTDAEDENSDEQHH